MSDQVIYNSNLESANFFEPFTNKQVSYLIDSNGGSYSGNQIIFDTSSFSNSGRYQSWLESILEIPCVITLQNNNAGINEATFNHIGNAFVAGLKAGDFNLIHSISVDLGNSNVVSLCPYTNFYVNYKLLTTLSESDVKKYGYSGSFIPDTPTSYVWQTGAAAGTTIHGIGNTNNRNANDATHSNFWESVPYTANPAQIGDSGITGDLYNVGYKQRQKSSSYDSSGATNFSNYNSVANLQTSLTNYVQYNTAANGGITGYIVYYYLAQIRLKHLHDFFQQLGLCKGTYARLIVNLNQSVHTIAMTIAGGAMTRLGVQSNICANGSTPLLFSSTDVNNGANYLKAAATAVGNATYTFTLRWDVVKHPTNAAISHPLNACRIYLPLYSMRPQVEEQYLKIMPTKKIFYKDLNSYQILNIGSGAVVNQLLSNGTIGIQNIIIIPFISGTQGSGANPGVANTGNPIFYDGANYTYAPPYQSPFCAEPSVTSPVGITDLQIVIAGTNIFTNLVQYDWDMFLNELSKQNSLNGGVTDGLQSGLINQLSFFHQHKYYVVDVSRRLSDGDLKIPRSISVQFKNNSQRQCDYFVFVEYMREIEISSITGSRVL